MNAMPNETLFCRESPDGHTQMANAGRRRKRWLDAAGLLLYAF